MDEKIAKLSPRQKQCLRLTYRQLRTKEIARELGIQTGTVAGYIEEAKQILGTNDRRTAARLLYEAENAPPSNAGVLTDGAVPSLEAREPDYSDRSMPHLLGPLAPRNREANNEYGILARIGWIVALAAALAIGFGAIIDAIRTFSEFLAR